MGNYFQKIIGLFILAAILSISNLQAQAPLGFNYQGVALTNAGTPVASKKISLRISLLESQQLGTVIYQETHGTNTDAYGQFSIIIGNGQAVTGKMSNVQWSKFPYYMKVELDLDGGTSFVFVGTSQLLSVPYALYANNAGAASISVDSVKNELATIRLTQKGDSIVLSNNRGSVLIPKIDSISKIVSQIAGIKAGTIKSIKDSVSKLPNGFAIGYNALNNFDSTASNSSNIALGQSAGLALTKQTSGINNSDNILIGQNAAASINAPSTNAGAYQNVMIGNGAGQSTNALASQNVVIGHEAAKNSSGTIGTQTTVFNNNIAIGARSLKSAIISQSNVSIGSDNMNATTQANRNTMIGSNAVSKYNGDDNVIIGAEMLYDSSSNGSKNVIIGSVVAKNIRGSKNIILGYKAAYDSSFKNTNNRLIIANDSTRTPLIYGEFDNKKVTINGDLTITGKPNLNLSADTTIKALKKTIDSLVAAMSTKSYARIDSSTLLTANPVIVTKFLDSTFLPVINFDGIKTHILIGKTNLYNFPGSFTAEAWIKNTGSTGTFQRIMGNGSSSSGEGYRLGYSIGILNNRLYTMIGSNLNNINYSLSTDYPNDSLWHHVSSVLDLKNKNVVLYIDGIEKIRQTATFVPERYENNGGGDEIGANYYDAFTNSNGYFKGNLRKLRVSKGAVYTSNFTPSYTYKKADSTLAFWELNDLGTHIKASDSAYNGTLYNGTWLVPDTSVKINDGLVGYYPFNGNANDSSVIGNNGIVTGAILTTDRFGKTNSAYLFKDNFITIPNNKAYEFNNYTISFWASTSSATKQVPIIKLNYEDAYNEQFGFAFNDTTLNGFQFAAKYNNTNCLPGVGWQKNNYFKSFSDGIFHHYVGTINEDRINLYIDGILVNTITGPSKLSSSCFGGDIQIGRNWKSFNDYFQGKIDDLRIYNRVLNSYEITYLSTH